MSVKEATLNSIFIIFFSQLTSLIFTIFSTGFTHVNSSILFMMIVSGVIGGFIGSRLAKNLSNKVIETVFHIGILIVTVISLTNIARFFIGSIN